MRILASVLVAGLPLAAAYTYFTTAAFTAGIPGTNWQTNGTIGANGTDGLTTTNSNGGSVIYTDAGSSNTVYESYAKMRITASGGTLVMYSLASADALSGPAAQGTFYAAEFSPVLSGGGCTMTANYYKRVSGTVTLLASQTLACKDGMTIRWTQRSG